MSKAGLWRVGVTQAVANAKFPSMYRGMERIRNSQYFTAKPRALQY